MDSANYEIDQGGRIVYTRPIMQSINTCTTCIYYTGYACNVQQAPADKTCNNRPLQVNKRAPVGVYRVYRQLETNNV